MVHSKSSINLSFPIFGILCVPVSCQPYFGEWPDWDPGQRCVSVNICLCGKAGSQVKVADICPAIDAKDRWKREARPREFIVIHRSKGQTTQEALFYKSKWRSCACKPWHAFLPQKQIWDFECYWHRNIWWQTFLGVTPDLDLAMYVCLCNCHDWVMAIFNVRPGNMSSVRYGAVGENSWRHMCILSQNPSHTSSKVTLYHFPF